METYALGLRVERLSGERIFRNLVLIKLFPRRGTKEVLFIIYIPVVGFENGTPKGAMHSHAQVGIGWKRA